MEAERGGAAVQAGEEVVVGTVRHQLAHLLAVVDPGRQFAAQPRCLAGQKLTHLQAHKTSVVDPGAGSEIIGRIRNN